MGKRGDVDAISSTLPRRFAALSSRRSSRGIKRKALSLLARTRWRGRASSFVFLAIEGEWDVKEQGKVSFPPRGYLLIFAIEEEIKKIAVAPFSTVGGSGKSLLETTAE